ncbi:MAG TPA: DMT family transporter [Sphingobium sp.]|uniref:DMT family transporter n=1 Tax=Sphingobium sp. TaxID=1912891 RepID=UPI002ED19D78
MPDRRALETGLALFSGVLLAIMIDWNSLLAHHSSPVTGSWATHGVGTLASLGLMTVGGRRFASPVHMEPTTWPRWIYLGGIAGAFAVLLAAITVNGPLGLAGTLALMLAGQLLFTLAVDRYGLLGLTRRPISSRQLLALVLILGGGLLIIEGHPI